MVGFALLPSPERIVVGEGSKEPEDPLGAVIEAWSHGLLHVLVADVVIVVRLVMQQANKGEYLSLVCSLV